MTDSEELEGGFTDEDARLRLLFKAFRRVKSLAQVMDSDAVEAMDTSAFMFLVDDSLKSIRRQCDRIDALKYPEGSR